MTANTAGAGALAVLRAAIRHSVASARISLRYVTPHENREELHSNRDRAAGTVADREWRSLLFGDVAATVAGAVARLRPALRVAPRPKGTRGTQAIVGALVAVIGALSTAHPTSTLLKALSEAVPQLAAALPMLITAVGAIVAALSEPPVLKRK